MSFYFIFMVNEILNICANFVGSKCILLKFSTRFTNLCIQYWFAVVFKNISFNNIGATFQIRDCSAIIVVFVPVFVSISLFAITTCFIKFTFLFNMDTGNFGSVVIVSCHHDCSDVMLVKLHHQKVMVWGYFLLLVKSILSVLSSCWWFELYLTFGSCEENLQYSWWFSVNTLFFS